jgi:predicted RNase H-like HicB family nuclease
VPWKPTLAEKPMRRGLILVKAAYDADAAVWFVESSDLEGVNAEAPSLEALLQKLPAVVLDLLEEEGFDDVELPIEVVAHASTRVRRSTAA